MRYTKEQSDRLLALLEQHLEKDPGFSKSDQAALQEMMLAWKGWIALGRGTKWLITALGLVAAAVASWGVLSATLKGWLQS